MIIFLLLAQSLMAQWQGKLSGITLVAPRDSFSEDPILPIKEVNAQWIAVVPYSFTPANTAHVYFGNDHQWWGETPAGAESTIELAKAQGMKVMLKPQVWMHNGWVGDMDYKSESDWRSWEKDYRKYILSFAKIAARHDVEILCIGTELRLSVSKRPEFWIQLIKDVRQIYEGKLTYCANWDDYDKVTIWNELDIIALSAYFPLSDATVPSIKMLCKEWKPIVKQLEKFARKYDKSILFAEYGYLSVEGCAGKTWELEDKRMQLESSETAQCYALDALYKSFYREDFWLGGFLWKWYPRINGRSTFYTRDYTPQDKAASKTISYWYDKLNKSDSTSAN